MGSRYLGDLRLSPVRVRQVRVRMERNGDLGAWRGGNEEKRPLDEGLCAAGASQEIFGQTFCK